MNAYKYKSLKFTFNSLRLEIHYTKSIFVTIEANTHVIKSDKFLFIIIKYQP